MSTDTVTRSPGPASGSAEPLTTRKHAPLYWRRTRVAWGFALPFVLLFTVFTAGPVLMSLAMAVTDIHSRDLRNPLAVSFIGIDNFTAVFADPMFRKAAMNTAYFVLVGVPLTLGLSLAIAVVLNAGVTRLKTFFRVGYYMPVVTSIVAVAVVWRFLLHPDNGLLNEALRLIGIEGPNWLGSTTWALPSMIAMATWRSIGTLIIIFLAGLQGVPTALHEAAALDGANTWQRFRYITVPTIRPTLLFGAAEAVGEIARPVAKNQLGQTRVFKGWVLATQGAGRHFAQALQDAAVGVADKAAVKVFIHIRRFQGLGPAEHLRPQRVEPAAECSGVFGVDHRQRQVQTPACGHAVDRAQVANDDGRLVEVDGLDR